MITKRRKWDGKVAVGLAVGYKKCDCVKEIIGGKVTYFLNDALTEKAPPCSGAARWDKEIDEARKNSNNPKYN